MTMMRLGRKNTTNDRLRKLARNIEAMARKDEQRLRETAEIDNRRSRGALDLYITCSNFVDAVNGLLPSPMLELSPPEYAAASFRDPGGNVFQINMSGRMVHIEFRAAETPTSTERFRIPYILEGSLRALNQELLDLAAIPEQLLFCCIESNRLNWLWFDPRTRRTGTLDQEHLIGLLERLV
jgi:hypothetical protein